MTTDELLAPFEAKASSTKGRRFRGLASTYDVDYGGDLILPGAYAKTLQEWRRSGRIIPLVDQHNYGSVTSVVGKLVSARETRKGPETEFQFLSGEEGERYARRVKEGIINGLSIGYNVKDDRAPTAEERARGARRVLTEVHLREVSLVIWGMNASALIDTASVKHAPVELPSAWRTERRKEMLRDLQLRSLGNSAQASTHADREDVLRRLTLRSLEAAI